MVVAASIFLARIMSLISERCFVSEIELELPYDFAQEGLRGDLVRGIGRLLLRGMILFAGVGGIHTGFSFCPEHQAWLRGSDLVHVVAGPPAVAGAIGPTTHTRTLRIGRSAIPIPMHLTLCRYCHFPLRVELLTPMQTQGSSHAETQSRRGGGTRDVQEH